MNDALQSRARRETRLVTSPRFKSGRFWNTARTEVMREHFGAGMALDFFTGRAARSPRAPLPVFEGTRAALSRPPERGLRLTWLGHSTVLLEIDGVRLLTDPVWGERASPVSFAGPRRFHRPPLPLAELPPVDAVLLSHDHYDHLCASTVRSLASGAAPGFSGRFLTTLGVGAHLEKLGVPPGHISELDWSQGVRVGEVDVIAVPAQHFSGRSVLDRNHTLWAGFVILGPHHRVFFSGDTGPTAEHADIGASFGPFDVVMFEIGAFHPAWGDIHLGPDAAYQAFLSCNARAFLPVHWSTFDLGLHPWEEPGELLYERAVADGAPLWTPRIGEPMEQTPARPSAWWREALGARASQGELRPSTDG